MLAFCQMIMLVIGGSLADKFGYFVIMKIGVAVLCLVSFPSYYLLNYMYSLEGEGGVKFYLWSNTQSVQCITVMISLSVSGMAIDRSGFCHCGWIGTVWWSNANLHGGCD